MAIIIGNAEPLPRIGSTGATFNPASTNVTTASGAGKVAYNFPNLVPNPLEKFASYSTLFTMSAMDPAQYNNPIELRNNPASIKNVIFSSAGRYDKERVLAEPGVRPEYFVESFKMTNLIAPKKETGNTNAIGFNLEIYEPYSMGLFLQSLQVAALNAGYINYLNDCPYLIKIDFSNTAF
jgi:hypothetical protein